MAAPYAPSPASGGGLGGGYLMQTQGEVLCRKG